MAKVVTIRDVAKKAGVSPAAVSSVLNGKAGTAPETALRVESVARAMGYTPRSYGGARKERRSDKDFSVAVLVPTIYMNDLGTPLTLGLAEGVQKAIREVDGEVVLVNLKSDESVPSLVRNGKVKGVIVRSGWMGDHPMPSRSDMVKEIGDLPCVWAFDVHPAPAGVDAVMVDNQQCGAWAAREMLQRGYSDVICVLPSNFPNLAIQTRILTFKYMLDNAGVKCGSELDPNAPLPQAIFVPGHDVDVAAVVAELKCRGITPGKEVALFSVVTDEDVISSHINENCRALHMDASAVGMAAARQLIWRLNHPTEISRSVGILMQEVKVK